MKERKKNVSELTKWKEQLETVLSDFLAQVQLSSEHTLVIGCSTSEVIGEKIGTAGAMEVAEMIFDTLSDFRKKTGVHLAFQCCEHLNRALVVERELARKERLEIVSVVPIHKAGGAMATQAYGQLKDPVLIEFIKADAGIDIGDTFIGMHLKHVAVPVRCTLNAVGHAHVTLAKTRPKLIGGMRAFYELS